MGLDFVGSNAEQTKQAAPNQTKHNSEIGYFNAIQCDKKKCSLIFIQIECGTPLGQLFPVIYHHIYHGNSFFSRNVPHLSQNWCNLLLWFFPYWFLLPLFLLLHKICKHVFLLVQEASLLFLHLRRNAQNHCNLLLYFFPRALFYQTPSYPPS